MPQQPLCPRADVHVASRPCYPATLALGDLASPEKVVTSNMVPVTSAHITPCAIDTGRVSGQRILSAAGSSFRCSIRPADFCKGSRLKHAIQELPSVLLVLFFPPTITQREAPGCFGLFPKTGDDLPLSWVSKKTITHQSFCLARRRNSLRWLLLHFH